MVFLVQSLGGIIMGAVYAVGRFRSLGVMRYQHPCGLWLLGAFRHRSSRCGSIPVSLAFIPFLVTPFIYRIVIAPVTRAKEVMISSMIITFGLAIILETSCPGAPTRLLTTRIQARRS
jgi:hypothetical protein